MNHRPVNRPFDSACGTLPARLAPISKNIRFPEQGLPSLGRVLLVATLGVICLGAGSSDLKSEGLQTGQSPSAAADLEYFEKKVRPILVNRCYHCHSADTKPAGAFRVDDRNGLFAGGDSGPPIVPGDPEKSLLIRRLRDSNPKKRMPQESEALAESEINELANWIKNGAAWPRESIPAPTGAHRPDYKELKAKHWAWQPLKKADVPKVSNSAWPKGEVDRFLLAKLESKGLHPVGDADTETLLRRITYDLTGLPPTPAEIESFLADKSPDAYERRVNLLLASPRFAELWGRHWLDVARYGESTGPSRNIPYPHAWKYRDYVIDAVGRDIPFDRFIHEQIAGDLLPAANRAERDRLNIATGFLALGVKDVNQRFKIRFQMDNVDEQVDVVTRSILGVTVSCARCHDHKFDPVPTTDYYALAGIFTSTDNCAGVRNKMGGGGLDYYDPAMLVELASEALDVPKEKIESLKTQVADAKKAWDSIRGTPEGLARGTNGMPRQLVLRREYERLDLELKSLTDPITRGYAAHGVREAKTIGDTEVRIRGEAERIGPTVPRGFLSLFEVPGAPQIDPKQSGRLQLAQWLTHPANPLTARVAVNRVWSHLFGQGIVNTVDNFGVTGDVPSHPELLDYLAVRFMGNGWSLKSLIRELVLSHAYRLGVEAPAAYRKLDPENRLVWRHSPRRLTTEEFRDAVLASASQLDLKSTAPSEVKRLRMIEMADNGREALSIHTAADTALVRSVYLPQLRGVTPKSLEAFDPVDQTLVSGRRESTTVPTQALFLLNSPFVHQQSLQFAQQLLAAKDRTTPDRLREAYLRTLARPPTRQEVVRATKFLASYEATFIETLYDSPAIAANEFSEAPAAREAASTTVPANPDDIQRPDNSNSEKVPHTVNPRTAAWAGLVQALYGTAEFRYIR